MTYLLTGMHGTVAPAIAKQLTARGDKVIAFDRSAINIEDYGAVLEFLRSINPDCVMHLAFGTHNWSRAMAEYCRDNGKKFVYISTVDIYGEHTPGPYTVQTEPRPETDYARYKLDAERTVAFVNHDAYIIRIGWQIGDAPGSNNMIDYLVNNKNQDGTVDADDSWYPSCSRIKDTVVKILKVTDTLPPDLYLINDNEDKTFFKIVCELAEEFPEYNIRANRIAGMNRNNIMLDTRTRIL